MDDKRAILADHVEDRVTVTGMFDKFSLYVNGVRQWKTALLQDVFVQIEGKDIDLGHMWVNRSYTLGQPPKAEDFDFGVNDHMSGEDGQYYCAACERVLDEVTEPQ